MKKGIKKQEVVAKLINYSFLCLLSE